MQQCGRESERCGSPHLGHSWRGAASAHPAVANQFRAQAQSQKADVLTPILARRSRGLVRAWRVSGNWRVTIENCAVRGAREARRLNATNAPATMPVLTAPYRRTARYYVDGIRGWIEDDLCLPDSELPDDLRDFLFERKLSLAVFGALAQHK
jgi:hypothetical protein